MQREGSQHGRWQLTLCRRTGACHYVAGQQHGPRGPTLQRDGEEAKVTEHVHDRGEAQVLHTALAPLGQREAQVLSFSLVVEGEHVVTPPGFALPDQEDPMSLGP